jgi:Xaa-Pro aminopeptidase
MFLSTTPHRPTLLLFSIGRFFSYSLEPGYYEDGQFGIRIENVMIVKKIHLDRKTEEMDFLGFEHVTLVPLQRKLIDISLLSTEQLRWIDMYHAECRYLVSPYLKENSLGWAWLQRETKPIIDQSPISKRLRGY